MRSGYLRYVAQVGLLAAVYFATAKLSLLLAIPPGNATPVWPPAGIALAAVLLLGYRVWPGIFLGATLVNATTEVSVATAASIGVGNTLEALLAAALLRRLVGAQSPFQRGKDIFIFGGLVGGLSCMVAATVGVTSLWLGDLLPWAAYVPNWLTWWLGDVAGIIVVTPLILTWRQEAWGGWDRERLAEVVILLTLLLATSLAIFGHWPLEHVPRAMLYLILPLLGWTAFRFGPRETATAVALVVGIATWGTVRGGGPFRGETLNESLLLLQSFISIVGVACLALAAAVAERREIEASLQTARDELDGRVQQRTAELALVNETLRAEITERIRAENALRESEESYRLVAETAPDAIITSDEESRILFANAAAAELFGYAIPEMLGQPLTMLIPERLRGRYLASLNDYLATGKRHVAWERIELPGRHKHGNEVPVEISFAEFRRGGKHMFTGIIRDIRERKRAEEALASRTRQLEAVREVTAEVTRELSLHTLLRLITRRATELVAASGGAIHLWDDGAQILVLAASHGQGDWRKEVHVPVGEGVVGTAAQRRKGMVVNEYRTSPYVLPFMLERTNVTAVLAEPLLCHDRLLGVIGLDNEGSGRPFTERDRELLALFASQAAIAIENARLYEAVRSELTQRKRVEAALRESEERFRRAFEEAAVGLAIADAKGRFLQVNRAYCEITGYAEEELYSRDFLSITHPDDLTGSQEQVRRLLAGEMDSFVIEKRYLTKSGHFVWVRNSVSGIRDGEGTVVNFIALSENITRRKLVEEALRESEARFRELYDDAPVGYHELDAEGRIVRVNRTELAMLGYTAKEMLGRPVWKFVVEKELSQQSVLDKLAGVHPVPAYERTFLRKDGIRIPVLIEERILRDSEGRTSGIRSTLQDITQRKRVEDALRESEEGFRLLVEGVRDYAIFLLDSAGRVVTWNTGAERVKGYQAEEIIGQHFSRFYPAEEIEAGKPEKELHIVAREGRLEVESWRVRRDGTRFWANVIITALRDETGRLRGFTKITRDITERKRAEEELIRSRAQLRTLAAHLQSIREEERTWIAREIHDELGQALTGLKMDLVWLKSKLPGDGGDLQEKTRSMSRLIDTTIQSVRKMASELRPGVLDELGLVAAIEWQAQQFQTRTGIRCRVSTPLDSLTLNQDRATAIFRICQEALTNVARHAGARRVQIRMEEEAGDLILEVRDNGKGIAERMVSSSKSFGLLGMRERALLMGGEVTITGSPGKGTTVLLRVPLREPGEGSEAR